MHWMEQILNQFYQELGMSLPLPSGRVMQLVFEQGGIVQLEQHDEQLTVWLAYPVLWHQRESDIVRAMSVVWSQCAPELPVRCSWQGEQQLLLLITLEACQVTVPVLHQSLQTLQRVRREIAG